jgi:biopolymer transport protein ExbD
MKIKSNPNVVPLCDILLVLLIIFMVITPMTQVGMDVRVPDLGREEGGPVVLTIERDGVIIVNNETFYTLEALEKRLTEIYKYRSEKVIFVQAHETVAYKDVVKVMDVAKGAGVETICVMPRLVQR